VTTYDDGARSGPDDGVGGTGSPGSREAEVRLTGVARPLRLVVCAIVAVALTAGCGIAHGEGLNFRVDNRLHFLSPKDRSSAHLPLTIRWKMSDFTVAPQGSAPPSPSAGFFVVFVDRAPVRPGQSLTSVCKSDPFARGDKNCPTAAYLAGKGIYLTTADQLTLQNIPNLPGNKDKKQLHTFVVTLMDTAGRRIGESAWELDLHMPRTGG